MDNQTTPRIGKFVIESLTTGMYDNALCVYREYIQNSADSIDKAISLEIVSAKEASIYIQIKSEEKTIIFHDNAMGISENMVIPILQNIAQSDKEVGKDKGFRGIGRLGGLAYCETLLFETSHKGEATKSIMKWNAKELKRIVNDRTQKEEVSQVIKSVTKFSREEEKVEAHYFKVIMQGVTNEDLLDEKNVKQYLEMVAPVPYNTSFIFKSKIYEEIKKENFILDEYKIYINKEQIYKGYSTYLYDVTKGGERKKIGEIKDIQFFRELDSENNLLYWGWHSISSIQNERLNKLNKSRGLRLRKGNIQIGNEFCLETLFRDTRFNFYVLGEVHAVHKKLTPNSRRDNFEDSVTYTDFSNKLKNVCNKIQKMSNDASGIKSATRKIDELEKSTTAFQNKEVTGFLSSNERTKLELELEQKRKNAEKAEKDLAKYKENAEKNETTVLTRVFDEITKEEIKKVANIEKPKTENKVAIKYITDDFSKLNKSDRKLIGRVIEVIGKVLPKDLTENLVQKIKEEFE